MNGTYWRRGILFFCVIIIIAVFIAYFTMFRQYFTLETIKIHRAELLSMVQAHYILSVLLYMLSYLLLTISSLPVPGIMTVLGGFLFGMTGGIIYGNIAAILGSIAVFVGVRNLLGKPIQERYAKKFSGLNGEIQRSGASYLFLVQLMGIFPYFMIAFVAGVTSVSMLTFVWTMALGMLPVSCVYAYAGKQLGTMDTLSDIFTPGFMIAIGVFVTLSVGGLLWKRYRRKRKSV